MKWNEIKCDMLVIEWLFPLRSSDRFYTRIHTFTHSDQTLYSLSAASFRLLCVVRVCVCVFEIKYNKIPQKNVCALRKKIPQRLASIQLLYQLKHFLFVCLFICFNAIYKACINPCVRVVAELFITQYLYEFTEFILQNEKNSQKCHLFPSDAQLLSTFVFFSLRNTNPKVEDLSVR